VGLKRLLDTQRHRRQRRVVKHDLNPGNRLRDPRGVGQIPFEELVPSFQVGQVLPRPGAQVVEHPHFVAALDKPARQMRPNEPRPACDQILRHGYLFPFRATTPGATLTALRGRAGLSRDYD
jgi:hypothetical protein